MRQRKRKARLFKHSALALALLIGVAWGISLYRSFSYTFIYRRSYLVMLHLGFGGGSLTVVTTKGNPLISNPSFFSMTGITQGFQVQQSGSYSSLDFVSGLLLNSGRALGFTWPKLEVSFNQVCQLALPFWLLFVLAATTALWLYRRDRPMYAHGRCQYCGSLAAKPEGVRCRRCDRILWLTSISFGGTAVPLLVYMFQPIEPLIGLGIPEWLFLAWGTLVFSFFAIPTVLTLWYGRKYHPSGFCLNCDYDLTGNVSGICPECGEVIPPTVNGAEMT